MSNSRSQLFDLCENPPAELLRHFETLDPAAHPRLLSLADTLDVSHSFREFHPLATALGLVFLDDEHTSNHHAYVSVGPLAGTILYLSHDGDTRVVFESLAVYQKAVELARKEDLLLYNFHPERAGQAHDQAALQRRINELITDGEEDELLVLISSWNLSDLATLEKLVRDENFYVAEAVGKAMELAPRTELMPFAQQLARHKHFQAANAGKRAIASIQNIDTRAR